MFIQIENPNKVFLVTSISVEINLIYFKGIRNSDSLVIGCS